MSERRAGHGGDRGWGHHHHPHVHCHRRHRRDRGWLPWRRRRPVKLHRKIFFLLGLAIFATTGIAAIAGHTLSPDGGWRREREVFERFVGARFAERWDEPKRREALAEEIATALDGTVRITDAAGRALTYAGDETCPGFVHEIAVRSNGAQLGTAYVCATLGAHDRPLTVLIVLLFGALFLWGASGFIARRIVRPVDHLVSVARAIGDGKLETRATVRGHRAGELALLADAINEMAGRIEKQLADQRELLAAVSHELRTPLGHIRALLDIARLDVARLDKARDRDGEPNGKPLDEIEKEVLEIDALVGQLLASSRLEFGTLRTARADVADLALIALERADLDVALLEVEGDDPHVQADATLVLRALANLLENAMKHGAGVARLHVEGTSNSIAFSVEDRGRGFTEDELTKNGELERVFDTFYRGDHRAGAQHASLGLGLALVARIARAHGGTVRAENLTQGGARVTFTLSRA